MNKVDAQNAIEILKKHLKAASKEAGIEFSLGNRITFDATSIKVQLMGNEVDEKTNEILASSVEQQNAFRELVISGILAPNSPIKDPIGRDIITSSKGECKLVGYNSRARKYPWVIEVQGKRYKTATQAIEGFAVG